MYQNDFEEDKLWQVNPAQISASSENTSEKTAAKGNSENDNL